MCSLWNVFSIIIHALTFENACQDKLGPSEKFLYTMARIPKV